MFKSNELTYYFGLFSIYYYCVLFKMDWPSEKVEYAFNWVAISCRDDGDGTR